MNKIKSKNKLGFSFVLGAFILGSFFYLEVFILFFSAPIVS